MRRAQLVKVTYERLPHVTDLEEAMEDDAPAVFPGRPSSRRRPAAAARAPGLPQRGNVRGPDTGQMFGLPRGDAAKGLADADVVVEAEYRTQVQTHVPMETHGIVADWREDGLTIYASTQFTTSVRDEAAEMFNLPKNRVRVISDFTGGGFGAKYGIGNFGLLAINLSRKAGAPVRLMLDRREEHVSVGNRPSSLQRLKIGAARDGSADGDCARGLRQRRRRRGAGVGFAHSMLYPCPNVSADQYDVFTNAGPCAAFRAPGQVQGIFRARAIHGRACRAAGYRPPCACGTRIDSSGIDDSHARRVQRRIGAEKFGWSARRAPNADAGPAEARPRVAQSHWVSVIYPPTSCEVRIIGDGSVEAFSAAQDIGTGTRTVMAQVVAEELGLAARPDRRHIGDTRYPIGPPSGGSRVTGSLTPAARNAAYRAARDLAARLAPFFAFSQRRSCSRGTCRRARAPATWLPFKDAVKKAGIIELAQRARTPRRLRRLHAADAGVLGRQARHRWRAVRRACWSTPKRARSRSQRIVAVHDCGRPINPKLTESQIYGGVIQGLSYALYEERHLDPTSGLQLNANIDQYKIVGSRDVPAIEVHVIEQLTAQTSTDARGVAEPANVATAAALANAFYNATGKRIRTLPLTPANVLTLSRA